MHVQVEAFWGFYSHLKRPSEMAAPSDYQVFRKGIKPIWEDAENKQGGKWLIRVKKEFSDRLWEDLLLAIVGNQFESSGGYGEVCGAVISIRETHDVISLWIKSTNKIVRDKIRDSIKYVLKLPGRTILEWRVHDSASYKLERAAAVAAAGSAGGLISPLSAGGPAHIHWPTSPTSPTGSREHDIMGMMSASSEGLQISFDQQ